MDGVSGFDLAILALASVLVVAWVGSCVYAIGQVLRAPDLSRSRKALWTVFLIAAPLVGIVTYVVTRPRVAADAQDFVVAPPRGDEPPGPPVRRSHSRRRST
jgi:hypothetical protein